jgi:hypothetical protein
VSTVFEEMFLENKELPAKKLSEVVKNALTTFQQKHIVPCVTPVPSVQVTLDHVL